MVEGEIDVARPDMRREDRGFKSRRPDPIFFEMVEGEIDDVLRVPTCVGQMPDRC